MIAGLSLGAWLLIAAAVVPALVLVAVFYAAHRPGRASRRSGTRAEDHRTR